MENETYYGTVETPQVKVPGIGVASFVMAVAACPAASLLSFCCAFIPYLGTILSLGIGALYVGTLIASLIMNGIATKKMKETYGKGHGLLIAGKIVAIVLLCFWAITLVVVIICLIIGFIVFGAAGLMSYLGEVSQHLNIIMSLI